MLCTEGGEHMGTGATNPAWGMTSKLALKERWVVLGKDKTAGELELRRGCEAGVRWGSLRGLAAPDNRALQAWAVAAGSRGGWGRGQFRSPLCPQDLARCLAHSRLQNYILSGLTGRPRPASQLWWEAEAQPWPLRGRPELGLEFRKHDSDAWGPPPNLSRKHTNTCISWMFSSSLVSTFFSIPSPRSKASRVVLSEVNPSFFRGSSTSEKQGQESSVRPLETGEKGGTGRVALEGMREPQPPARIQDACDLSSGPNRNTGVQLFHLQFTVPEPEPSPACCLRDGGDRAEGAPEEHGVRRPAPLSCFCHPPAL